MKTGLLRAPNTTSETVASVLVGETEAVRPDANQGLVVKPADNRTGSETSSTEEPSSAEANSDVEANALPTGNDLFAENLILRQCIHETSQMQNDLSQDVERMWQLKTELENAVEVLKGEIWSLNSQLKASILDREQLQDRVVQLDTSLEAEKKRADALDCELSEQTELTEKATRQAAEAENESNRRLAECLEMETRREQVEKAYAQLSEYYSQLQSAYNVIYAKLKQIETEKTLAESEQQAASSSTQDKNVEHVVNTMISELHLNVDDGLSLHGKVLLIQKVLREKLVELEQHHLAIAEHRRTNEVLNEQLKCLEEQSQKAGCETVDMMTRLKQLEGELEWKKDECNSLHRRAEELQAAIDQLVERNTEADALATSRLRIELAILAAKLATRQADVDALFRANAELVHTNVRLQNELDENEERATTSDQDVKIRDLQAELSASRNNEESLRRQLEEVRSILNETEQKLEEFASEKERSSRQADVLLQAREQPEPLSRPAECLSAATSLEESLKESVGLQEEVERLHAVEKLLNERIMCLEDQLLEVEEKLQETEEEFISERQKVEALEAEKQPSSREVEQADVSIQSDNDDGSQLCTACKAREQQAEKSNEDEWGLEASSSTAEHVRSVGELSRVKEELEKIRKQLTEQKLNPAERSAVVKEFQALQQLLREKDELFAAGDKPEQQWGWDDAQSEVTVDTSALRDRLSEMESIERQQQETIRAQETRIRALEEELSTADACREELEDATEQVNTLQKELREMKKQAQVYSEEQQRLVNRISELEAKTENAWGDEWDNADGGADEGKEELEQSKFEAHQRIAELELQIEQKVCALVDAEKELAMLRERLQAVGPERSDLQKNPDLPTSDEQSSRNMEKVLEEERHRREEAEALAENLRQVAATLRSQVDDLQEKLLNGMESAEKQLIQLNELSSENERLRKTIASRTELVEAEHQRSESELETLCEERRRIQNELSSAENEKIRLEEQLMACEMKCDDLKIELQLQKANNTELTGLHEEAKKRCEDAQIALKAVEAENSALLERLRKAEGELNELQRQLQETLSHCQQKGPSSDDGVHGNASQWERLEKILSEVRRELEEKELQNSLLKDSEARLLDSVDEYGLQAENYQKEAERLQNVVNQLERERLELEEEVEKMRRSNDRLGEAENKVKMMERERKELEERLRQQSTSTASSSNHDTEEMSKLSNQLNMLTAERNELRTRLQDAESRLQVSAQEKVAITRSYEQLRARLAARRQKLTSSGETRSRPPSAAISEEDVSQSSRRVEESVPPSPNAYVSQQEASIGHHNYREAISVFIDDVERFLDEQDEIFDGLTAAIDYHDTHHSNGNDRTMGKKKAVLKKTFSENLEAGDALTQNESKTSDSREDTPTLRSQVDRMREHSTRLIAEYNRKLETLRRENFQLTEELQHSRKLLEAQSSTCQELAEDENKTKSDDQGSREVDHDCQAASNLDCIVNNIKQSFALIASLGAEIPKSKLKRDRIVDSAKRSGMYNDVVNELGMEKSDHARHSDLLRSAELEISQVKESARIIEEERSRLRLENAELVEKIRTVEVLQASEQRHILQKTLEENGEDSDFDTMTSNGNLVTSSEDCEDHEPSKEENCEKLAQLTLKLSSTNEDLSSTKEKLEQAATQIVDLQTSYEAAQMEIKSSKEENSFLANRIREYEEMIRSAEEDLEKTRMAYADQKKENDDRRVQLDHVKRELDELQMTASEATILRERLVAVESELAESSQLNHHLRSQIDSQVSELNEQLLSKGQQISELEKTISAMEASSAETRARSATEVASLKKELAEANALVEKFSSELEVNSQVTAEEAREHVTAVKNAEANLKLVMEERDNVISELKNTKEQLHELEHDLSDALERCEVLTEEFNSERKKLQCELETARSAEESLVKELWKAEEESAAQNAIQEQMQEKMSRLLDESEALSLKMVEAAAQNEELMEEKESALKENMLLREEMQSIRDNLVAACVHRDELLMKVSNMEAINKMQENQSLSSATLEEHCASSGVVPATYKNESFSGSVVPEGQIIHNDEVVGLRERTKILEEELKFVRAEEKKLREQVGSLTEAVSTRESSLARYEVELVNLQVQLRERRERDTVTHLQSSVELKRSEETINHLRDDNVRLERELFLSHEQLECAKSEIIALQQSLERSEAIALTSRNDNQKLVEQLDRALFEKEQTLIMAGEGQEAAAKVIALERNIATLKSDYDEKLKQALEDLDSSEQQLRHLKDAAEQAYLQRDESFRKMESWRKRFELAAQEIESLIRSNEEVRHLEAALEKSRVEKSTLYEELSSQRSVLDRVLAEKDALLAQLAALNGQLDERTNRLRQAGEAKMDTTLRIVELESQIAALLREKDAVAGQEPGKSSNSGVNTDQSLLQMNSTQHVAVQIENEAELAEIERLRSDLRRAEQRIIELEEFERNVGDNHRSSLEASHSSEHVNISEWPHHFVSASTPLPSLITLLSRRLSALRHHPTRAIMPYFRYAMTVYAVVLHFMLIHCWFLAGCP
nr:unnamed protein product [Haemonchus contortus]